jgi:hypothetical protein
MEDDALSLSYQVFMTHTPWSGTDIPESLDLHEHTLDNRQMDRVESLFFFFHFYFFLALAFSPSILVFVRHLHCANAFFGICCDSTVNRF